MRKYLQNLLKPSSSSPKKEEIKELVKKIDRLQTLNANLRREFDNSRKMLQVEYDVKIRKLEKGSSRKIMLLQRKLDEMNNKCELLQNLSINLKDETDRAKLTAEKKYEKEISRLETKCKSLETANEKYKRRFVSLEGAYHKLKDERDKMEEKYKQWRREYYASGGLEVERDSQDFQDLLFENRVLKERALGYSMETKQKARKIAELREKLEAELKRKEAEVQDFTQQSDIDDDAEENIIVRD